MVICQVSARQKNVVGAVPSVGIGTRIELRQALRQIVSALHELPRHSPSYEVQELRGFHDAGHEIGAGDQHHRSGAQPVFGKRIEQRRLRGPSEKTRSNSRVGL